MANITLSQLLELLAYEGDSVAITEQLGHVVIAPTDNAVMNGYKIVAKRDEVVAWLNVHEFDPVPVLAELNQRIYLR
ncbi:hypothetical protein ACFXG4_23565 [Nocardia sp. NPDC059246]|uniref:hypothetical protein n=1 Tax=unclassified Nocardia TaxID=2637762 RepID=UPI0036C8F8B4